MPENEKSFFSAATKIAIIIITLISLNSAWMNYQQEQEIKELQWRIEMMKKNEGTRMRDDELKAIIEAIKKK
jgi:hypothetical protein